MPKESNRVTPALIERIEQAQELLREALVLANGNGGKAAASERPRRIKGMSSNKALDFSVPMRAFIKRHGIGLSGPKKFTLLLAYLAKGDLKKTVSLSEIKRHWSKMTAKGLLGGEFNPFYSSPAKENDWVNTEKAGSYCLRPSWRSIFDER